MSKTLIIKMSLAFVVAFCISIFIAIQYIYSCAERPLDIDSNTLFEIKTGESARHVLNKLNFIAKQPVSKFAGKIWLKFFFSGDTVKQGVYQLNADMALVDAFEIFVTGKQKQFSITLIEGQTFDQWLTRLKSDKHLVDDWTDEKQTETLARFSTDFGRQLSSFEGLLLANTYLFNAKSTVSEIVIRAFNALKEYIDEKAGTYGLAAHIDTPYKLLTLASIVEKETGVSSERPIIAGVFVNRLNRNMRLQTDPTIIYGLGNEYKGDITREHLRRPTPYNTYVIKGLPPTPIAMIGKEALDAVLYYEDTDYLYFVAKGDGTHYFSETLEAHNQAVRKYQLGQD